jgi:solute carrier family 35 protein C2
MVPMSIAGICKEVTTISISAWLFNDELTPLNITGVCVTIFGGSLFSSSKDRLKIQIICIGIAVFTYHKYRKSIDSPVPLDAHGNPIPLEDDELGLGSGAGVMNGNLELERQTLVGADPEVGY